MKTFNMILGILILTFTTSPSLAFSINDEVIGCYAVGADVPDAVGGNFLGLKITKSAIGYRFNVYVEEFVALSPTVIAYGRLVHETKLLIKYDLPDGFELRDYVMSLTVTSQEKEFTGRIDGTYVYNVPLVPSEIYCGSK